MGIKKGLHITKGVVVGLLLGLYTLLALLNSTVLQSYLGAAAGSYFSKEWGGKVRIGALHFSPFSHIVLDKIELISPTNDTIYYGDRISCRFKHFPFHAGGLKFDRVFLRNGSYHFESLRRPDGRMGTNLDFIIDYYNTGQPPPPTGAHFIVEVGELRMRNIDYIQDLPEIPGIPHYEHGVDIPHMRYLKTSGLIRNVRVDNDSVTCRVISLTTTEASGMHVVDLSMDVEVSPHVIRATNLDLQTDDSRVFLDAELTYHGWEVMDDYCNTVMHDVVIKPGTEANLCEAAYWAPVLWGLNQKIAIQGHFYGPVSDMHADNVVASFGNHSQFFLDAHIHGLPIIEQTSLNADIHRLHTHYDDLAAIRLPEVVSFKLPDMVKRMAEIDFDGWLKGSMRDCETFFNLNTHIGDLEGHAHLIYDTLQKDYAYIGDLDSRVLGIRSLLPNEWVSRTGFHLSFQGNGLNPQTMEAALEGRLYNTQFRGHNLNRTTLSAELVGQELTADLQLQDSLIDLDLSASAHLAQKRYNAYIQITDAHLADLDLIKSDSAIILSTRITTDLQGDSIESLTGTLALHNTHGQMGSRRLELDTLELDASLTNHYKRLSVNSDWLEAIINGYFQYRDLPLVARDFCNRYLPTYYNPFRQSDDADLTPLYDDAFDIDISWNDPQQTFQLLMPEVSIAKGTSFHASYNYPENLKLVLRSDLLAYDNITLHDMGINSYAMGDNYQLRLKATSITLNETALMENLLLTTDMSQSISALALRWDDNRDTAYNEGDLEFFFTSTAADNKLMIARPSFYFMGHRWNLICPSGIKINKERLAVNDLKIYGLGQSLSVKGYIAGKEEDYLNALFDGFALDQIGSALLRESPLELAGTINGTLNMRGFDKKPYIDANLVVENCKVNQQALGELNIRSNYKTEEGRLYLDLTSDLADLSSRRQPLAVHGSALITGNDGSLNFDIGLDDIGLQVAQPFLSQVASSLEGQLTSNLKVGGTLQHPTIDGHIALADGTISLIPTGVTYHFADTLDIRSNVLTLDNFNLHDLQQNRARVDGIITLNTQSPTLNLSLNTDLLTLYDKADDIESLYGTLVASLYGNIRGPFNNLSISANATALDGSELFVPISNKKVVSENEFITFIDRSAPTSTRTRTLSRQQTPTSNFDLLLNVSITPGMKLHMRTDFEQVEANVVAVGNGDLKVTMQGGQEPMVLGDYQFTSGDISLTLVQLINKTFSIEQGSTLNFPGDINSARFDISAVYGLRANLASLMGSNISDNYIDVQDVITLEGTLSDPSIKFDIRLPKASQSVADEVFSYIDRKNELEMLNQSISLLLMGQFASTGASSTNEVGEGIDGIGLITTSVGAIVSSLVKFVDVNVKYQAATATTTGQWDVGISKRWNKLYFESTFGYGTNSDLDAAMPNVLVGDVEMGYKYTPFVNIYGFHRTNTSYLTRNELPYKQGVGIKLTKDFNTIYDLFPWLRPRKEKSKNKLTAPDSPNL